MLLSRYRVLTSQEAAVAVRSYAFVAGKYTWLDKLMNPFWGKVAEVMPKWVAPNVITLIASIILNFGFVGIWVLPEPASYLGAGLALFLYQTLDAVDGKHARNIQLSTPVGAIFDHGCDAGIVPIVGLMVLKATFPEVFSEGQGMRTPVLAFLTALAAFWTTQWEEGARGQLEHEGVTEAVMVIMCIFVVRALFPDIFTKVVSTGEYGNLEFRYVCASLVLAATVFLATSAISRVSKVAGLRAPVWTRFLPGLTFYLISICLIFSDAFNKHPVYVLTAITANYWLISTLTVIGNAAKKNLVQLAMESLISYAAVALILPSSLQPVALPLVAAVQTVLTSVVVCDSLAKLATATGVPMFRVPRNRLMFGAR